jgi:LuxR family maltose regulon positive regulatory protein
MLHTTKLYPPRVRGGLISRPRLLDLLDGAAGRRLTVVRAPAGFGKSTAVAQWLARAGLPVAWASLDAGDDNPWSFFALVVAALRSIDRTLATGTQELLDGPGLLTARSLAESLHAELETATRPFALVLDDYHVITSPEIHESVAFLARHRRQVARLVITSRSEPPQEELRAGGEVFAVGREDLRFTRDEAIQLLNQSFGLDLAPGEVDALTDRAEGWVASLHLIGTFLRGQSRERQRRFVEESVGNVRFVDEYLWETVLQPLPDDLQAFLLRTSILDRFTADLGGAVAETDHAAALIGRCERDNLFLIPLDDRGEWFRYHRLFADTLRARLASKVNDAEVAELHRRGAAWLEARGFEEDAARHAMAGREWDRAIRLLEQIGAPLFSSDRVMALRSWLEGLPREALARSPLLAFWLAWALARSGNFNQSMPLLRTAEETWAAAGDEPNLGLVRLFRAYQALITGNFPRAIEEAKASIDRLPEDPSAQRSLAQVVLSLAFSSAGGASDAERALADAQMASTASALPWIRLIGMASAGTILVQQGKLLDATVLFRRMVAEGDHRLYLVVQNALYSLGQIYTEWNMLEEAERAFRQTEELMSSTRTIIYGNRICLGFARLAWARGEIEEAFNEVDRALDYAHQTGIVQHIRDARSQQARFCLASGRLALARRWADSSELDPYLPPEYERQHEWLTLVRLLILEGQSELALRVLTDVEGQAEAAGRHGEVVEMLMLEALAYRTDGDNSRAIEALGRALALGEPDGYVRSFADEGQPLVPLLRQAAARGSHRDYAQRLLAAIGGRPAMTGPEQTAPLAALSEREVEVLRLVAVGLPNREIGQRLFISEKTVKKHLSNILGKLQATNRGQALDEARRQGIL